MNGDVLTVNSDVIININNCHSRGKIYGKEFKGRYNLIKKIRKKIFKKGTISN